MKLHLKRLSAILITGEKIPSFHVFKKRNVGATLRLVSSSLKTMQNLWQVSFKKLLISLAAGADETSGKF